MTICWAALCTLHFAAGLTLKELEDVCSLNEEVLNEQYEKDNVVPQVRRVPQKTWRSLTDELTAYLSVGRIERYKETRRMCVCVSECECVHVSLSLSRLEGC